jgi:hypothetical protein
VIVRLACSRSTHDDDIQMRSRLPVRSALGLPFGEVSAAKALPNKALDAIPVDRLRCAFARDRKTEPCTGSGSVRALVGGLCPCQEREVAVRQFDRVREDSAIVGCSENPPVTWEALGLWPHGVVNCRRARCRGGSMPFATLRFATVWLATVWLATVWLATGSSSSSSVSCVGVPVCRVSIAGSQSLGLDQWCS